MGETIVDARVILSDETAHQESNKTKIFKWIQKHPEACKNTNATALARRMAREFGTINSLSTTMDQLVKAQALHKIGGKRKADYTINYLHKWVLPEVRENASEADKAHIKKVMEQINEQTKLDDQGCLVRKAEEKQPPVVIPPKVTQIPVNVETTKDGKSMNITITINLNI